MAKQDLIEPFNSPWSSPVITVPKKNDGIRFCIHYRKLNQVTVKDSQPLSNIDDSVSVWCKLVFNLRFTRSGFHQTVVNKRDGPKMAFCIP